MFDLRIAPSLENLPSRVVNLCWDEEDIPMRSLPAGKITLTTEERRDLKNAAYREYYARERARINSRRAQRRLGIVRPRQTEEERAAVKALYWQTNRERINAQRRKVL